MYEPAVPLGSTPPVPEANSPNPGAMPSAAREDHVHQRLTSVTWHVLNSSAEATVTFTQAFVGKPGIAYTMEESGDNQPVYFKVKNWITDGGGAYIGAVIKGYRAQVLPQNLVTVLLAQTFNPWGGSAVGVIFSVIAVKQS